MDSLMIEATRSSPAIRFDPNTHRLGIRGESYPENAAAFYAPVFAWLRQYLAGLDAATTVRVDLEILYLNSSSTKVMLNLLDLLEETARNGRRIVVDWLYDAENEAMLECGRDLSEEIEALTFNLVETGREPT